MLLNNEMPALYRHLRDNAVEVQMFSTDWILTLFAILVPVEVHAYFLTNFLCEGWIYFYKVVLTFLTEIEQELLREVEVGDVLMTLKDLAATPGRHREMASPERAVPHSVLDRLLGLFRQKSEEVPGKYWEGILKKAVDLKLHCDPQHLLRAWK
jgi:hypothetical protein